MHANILIELEQSYFFFRFVKKKIMWILKKLEKYFLQSREIKENIG